MCLYIIQALNPCLWHSSALLHLPAAWIPSLLGAPPPGPLGVTSQYPLHCQSQYPTHSLYTYFHIKHFSLFPVEIAGIWWEQLSYYHPNQLHGSGCCPHNRSLTIASKLVATKRLQMYPKY